jgi:hypothetical protein
MDYYVPSRTCYCSRCRCRGYMGPVVLITLGVLFLLSEFTHYRFHNTWPILLIAIGVVKVLGSSADTTNHVPPYVAGVSAAPPPQNPQPPQGVNHV